MRITLKVAATLLVGMLSTWTGPVIASGVPTIDVAGLTQGQVNQVANLAKYVEMIGQYKQQIEQMKRQYESLNGKRMLGTVMNDPKYSSYLPQDWKKVYSSVQNGGYSGLTGSARALRDATTVLDVCKDLGDPAQKRICRQRADKAAMDQDNISQAFDKATQRWDQIQGLLQQVNSTTDQKSIQELQARINGEVAALQNESTKMQMYAMLSAAQEKILDQQDREAVTKSFREAQSVDLKPVEFRK